MPGQILWTSGPQLFFSPQLSGQGEQITNGSRYQASGDVYNTGVSGGPVLYGNFSLICSASGFGAAVQAAQGVDLYLLPSVSGANFQLAATSGLPASALRGSFVTPVSGNVGRLGMMVEGVPLMPVRYQVWLQNNTGQTLTSGWSMFFEGFVQGYT